MGLSIHYSFDAGRCSVPEVLDIMKHLHLQSLRLSFHEVDAQVTHLLGEDCKLGSLTRSSTFLPLVASRFDLVTLERQTPDQIIGFTALPRLGSEALPIFLAQYPDSQDWVSSGHCKTMFSGLPKYGGIANFVLAHTMVVEVLCQAQQLGIVKFVFDESGYWEERNLLCLADRAELPTLADEVIRQAGSITPDFVSSLLRQIKSVAN